MDLSIILTYRCDSKCSMCYIWQNPTHPDYEISADMLRKLPDGFDYLNLTGGEPTLRKDLLELCDILMPKTNTLEISTNGLHPEVLVPIVRKYPSVKVRISVEGFEGTNDRIRGEKDGYKKKKETMEGLIAAGGTDLGFATTFQDENIDEVVDLYTMAREQRLEFATSALHNAFQFHKNDNYIYERKNVARKVEQLIEEMLKSRAVKDWFRAYLNLGLISKILGHPRLHPCTQGTDNVFIDPWGDVYACNVRNDLLMGNLNESGWQDIYEGDPAKEIRAKVAQCEQNCWMVSSAKTAMRNKHFIKLPKISVLRWVMLNKLRSVLGIPVPFDKYVDYGHVYVDQQPVQRTSFLDTAFKKTVQPSESRRYAQLDKYFNR